MYLKEKVIMLNVGIVGLGLIGGSMAKAYKKASWQVWGADINKSVLEQAKNEQAIDGVLDDEKIKKCELILIALYPEAALEFLREKGTLFNKESIVMDLCGVKQKVCGEAFVLAKKDGYHFIGAHPMAGLHKVGFSYSSAELFRGASMILVPPDDETAEVMTKAEALLQAPYFGNFTVTTALEHDRMIAFTSQLAHVVSNAYIKSPTAKAHDGFSAGSYKDLTRVAWLNEVMWSELFLDNRQALGDELDWLIAALKEYREALAENDRARLQALLKDGRLAKERIDGFEND